VKRQLVIAHFKNLYSDPTMALKLSEQAIKEMEVGNFKDIIGDVKDIEAIEFMKSQSIYRVGG
jgi:hypothetical protein